MSQFHDAVCVSEPSQVGEARRSAVRLAAGVGLDETVCGKVAIVATELATNLSRYATGGELLISPIAGAECGIELIAVDRGPGIPDVARTLQDGFSTGGTPGNGLGAVRRLASEFDIYSSDAGTVVLARFGQQVSDFAKPARLAWGAISRPAVNELICGDIWRIACRENQVAILVADGLGHGPLAAAAAEEAAASFNHDPFAPLSTMLRQADGRMRGTRGAAVSIAHLDCAAHVLKYLGVGNIAGSLRAVGEDIGRGLVSHNGTVGVQLSRVQEFEYACPPSGLLIIHSDGLLSRWSLGKYPGLQAHHPALIAAVLQRDFRRGKDDVTVAVVKYPAQDGQHIPTNPDQ